MPERTKWTTQEILNLNVDDTVTPGRLVVGTAVWDGANWIAEGGVQVIKGVDFSISQTGTAAWTPASGKKFVVTDYVISCLTAGVLTIFDGTDDATHRVIKGNFIAGGGAMCNYRNVFVGSAVDGVLKYTSDGTFTGYGVFKGYEV
jgi:hypothetical protein